MDQAEQIVQETIEPAQKKMSTYLVGSALVIGVLLYMVVKTPGKTSTATPTVGGAEKTTVSENSDVNAKTFSVEEGNFFFKPGEIRVKKGDNVKILFSDTEGIHDFVVDGLNVQSDRIGEGQTAQVAFTADKVGTFEYYCSVGQHRNFGMTGKLIVEE